jgi:hypothetical protein
MIGVIDTPHGIIPFAYHTRLKGNPPDGPVDFGSEETHPAITQAIHGAGGPIQHKIAVEKLKLAAENLVERARQGDQVAQGTLIEMRKNAQAGSERALVAYRTCREYIRSHPVDRPVNFGAENNTAIVHIRKAIQLPISTTRYAAIVAAFVPNVGAEFDATENAAVAMADGPPIDKQVVREVMTMMGKKNAFLAGYKNALKEGRIKGYLAKLNTEGRKAMQVGYALGLAKVLQHVRKADTMFTDVWPDIGWEMGE